MAWVRDYDKNDWPQQAGVGHKNVGAMITNDRRRLNMASKRNHGNSPANPRIANNVESRRYPAEQDIRKKEEEREVLPRPKPRYARKTLENGWILTDKLGSGGFGDVYKGEHPTEVSGLCAIKVEKQSNKSREVLPFEHHIYQRLQGYIGFPDLFFFCSDATRHYLGIQKLLGSLDDRFKHQNRYLHSTVIARICLQLVERLEVFHDIGFIHRDLKPHNFLVDADLTQETNFTVYLIDFGLSKTYVDKGGEHIPYRTDRKFMGTLKYAAINAQLGVEQSRRDDLESLGYVMIYLMNKGVVPWSENKKLDKEGNRGWILEQKRNMCIDELCAGFPPYLKAYFEYISMLEYEERPDYKYIRAIMRPYTKLKVKKVSGRTRESRARSSLRNSTRNTKG